MTTCDQRAQALLIDRATEGLDPPFERELDELLLHCPGLEPDTFELAAAALELACDAAQEPLPAALRRRVAQKAQGFFHRKGEA